MPLKNLRTRVSGLLGSLAKKKPKLRVNFPRVQLAREGLRGFKSQFQDIKRRVEAGGPQATLPEAPAARVLRLAPQAKQRLEKFKLPVGPFGLNLKVPVGRIASSVLQEPANIQRTRDKLDRGVRISTPERKALAKFNITEGLGTALDVGGAVAKVARKSSVLDRLGNDFAKAKVIQKQIKKGPGIIRSFKKNFLDRFSEVERVDRSFFRDLRLLSGGGSARAEQIITENTFPILQREAGRLEDFSKLISLERFDELVNKRGIKRQFNSEQIKQGFQELEDKLGPEVVDDMKQSGQQLRVFLNQSLDLLTESGVISKKAANAAKKNNQQYITFQTVGQMLRDSEDVGQGFARQSFNVAQQNVFKGIGESTSGIRDPLESTFQKLFRQIEIADRNSVLRDFAKRRPELLKGVKEGAKTTLGKGTIDFFEDGVKKTFEVDTEIATAVKNLDSETLPKALRLFTIPTQILKKGAVEFNPAFTFAVNPVRDLQDALVSVGTERSLKEAGQLLGTYGDNLSKTFGLSDEWAAWRRAGGAQGGLIGAEIRQAPEQAIKRGSQRAQKFLATVKSPGGLLNAFKKASTAIEEAPRLARFRQEAVGEVPGVKPFAAIPEKLREAAFASRTGTLDFARAGTVSRIINQFVPFFNVAVQGTARLVSLAKDNPKQFVKSMTVLAGIPAVTLYANNRRFEDFNEVQDFERENNIIVMLRDRTPQEKADDKPIQALKVPMGNIVKPFYNTIEEFLDFVDGRNPRKIHELALDLIEDLSPVGLPVGAERVRKFAGDIIPQFATPFAEQAANKNFFTGSPIVPRGLEGVEPREQFTEKTGFIPKALGRLTGISPLRLEAFGSSAAGTVGRAILSPKKGLPSATTGRFFGPKGGAETTRGFEDIRKVERQSKTAKLKRDREINKILKEVKGEGGKQRLLEIAKQDPELAESVLDKMEEESRGLTSLDKRVKTLGVKDGSRAKVISGELNKLETSQQKKDLLLDLSRKKILSPEVLDQVLELQQVSSEKKGVSLKPINLQGAEDTVGNILDAITPDAIAAEGPLPAKKEPSKLRKTLDNIINNLSEGIRKILGKQAELLNPSVMDATPIQAQEPEEVQQDIKQPRVSAPKASGAIRNLGRNPVFEAVNPKPEVKSAIQKAAIKFRVPEALLYDIALQESSLNPSLVNETPEGKAAGSPTGLAQFTDSTWEDVLRFNADPKSSLFRVLPNENRKDPETNMMAASYLIKFGQLGKWDASEDVWGEYWAPEELEEFGFYDQSIHHIPGTRASVRLTGGK